MRSLQDKIAIVTGASSGIGRATALLLAHNGANLTLASRNEAALQEVAKQIQVMGRETLVVPTDVTQHDQVKCMVDKTLARWGRVDILVANSGQYIRYQIDQLIVPIMEESMAVNFYGGLYCILAVLPHMLAQHSGHIVLVSTMDAKKGLPLDAPYVAAKSALSGFGEVMRQELYGTGVYVTSVFPGRVDTPMIKHLRIPWISAKISAEAVARSIINAILRHQPEVYIPARVLLLHYLNVLSPRLADTAVRVFHLEGWEE